MHVLCGVQITYAHKTPFDESFFDGPFGSSRGNSHLDSAQTCPKMPQWLAGHNSGEDLDSQIIIIEFYINSHPLI
jgi:hypothetical protein